jgi:uncharacterized protein (DUF433 family)
MAEQKPFIIHQDPVPLRVDAGGVIRVGAGRLTLAVVVDANESGQSAEEIATAYDVRIATIYAALSYYLHHRDEVKAYLNQQADDAFALRKQIEAQQRHFPSLAELHERLDHRHAETGQ